MNLLRDITLELTGEVVVAVAEFADARYDDLNEWFENNRYSIHQQVKYNGIWKLRDFGMRIKYLGAGWIS